MKPAMAPRAARELRVLVVDAESGAQETWSAEDLPSLVRAGDLVVVNDAATLPASLRARTAAGDELELRLVGALEDELGRVRFSAALLGSGDHRTRTEDRPPSPRVAIGETLLVGEELSAVVLGESTFSARLVDVELRAVHGGEAAATWAALYRAGRPVQYAHVPERLALWDVQNAWAGRPWAVEMPSAGRPLRIETLIALRARGIDLAYVTHAAGLSATGDAAIDARLPLPERFEVGAGAVRAVERARARGGRVLAIGTSVVRALESAARLSSGGPLRATSGTTDLRLGPATRRDVVDGLLTGVHESDTSHFELLGSFAARHVLDAALVTAEREGLLGHELGDAWLVWGTPATSAVAARAAGARSASEACAVSATVAA
jgi:S-adenosylmethionine:tRNA ribosyltransferase-isomerase